MNASSLDSFASVAGAFLPTQRTALHEPGGDLSSSTVLIVDPDPATAEGMAKRLRQVGLGSVLVAVSSQDIDDLLGRGVSGHLVLLSLGFGSECASMVTRLGDGGWNRVVVLLSTLAEIGPVIDAMGAGADGVIVGRHLASPVNEIPSAVSELSAREIEVIRLVAEGRSNAWIGEQLALSGLTVKSHLARIGRKLGTGDRAQMVAVAMRAGVIS